MLGWANAQAIELTKETGELHLWSRSRAEIWHKGATSGNTQRVASIRLDCDGDAVLILVDPDGPICHTGQRTCFHAGSGRGDEPHLALPRLEQTIRERAGARPEGSYTASLLDDPQLIAAKVREEAEEVARASLGETDQRVVEEAADVIFHLAVLLRSRGIDLADVAAELDARAGG